MGEVLPQGNPPKSLRGQPRTPVRPLAHEKSRALGYEPGGHPPKEVFDVLDRLDEIAESCSPTTSAEIGTCADRMRDLLIGGN